jgi:hypothetical protein
MQPRKYARPQGVECAWARRAGAGLGALLRRLTPCFPNRLRQGSVEDGLRYIFTALLLPPLRTLEKETNRV